MQYARLNCPGLRLVNDHVVRKTVHLTTREAFLFMQAVLKHFITYPDPMVVPVHRYDVIQATLDNVYGTFSYSYDMQRLGMLSENEKEIIESAYYLRHGLTPYALDHEKTIQMGRKHYPNLVKFITRVLDEDRYRDTHCGNFLKDENQDYRIIDLEGYMRYPLDSPENQWIAR
jgi:hypothetical protein